MSNRAHCRPHRGAGSESIIDEDDAASVQIRRRPIAAVTLLACIQFRQLRTGNQLDRLLRVRTEGGNNIFIEHAHAAARDRPHGQL